MSIYYTPYELAAFIKMENHTVREQFEFIYAIWSRRGEFLDPKGWNSFSNFRHAVSIELMLQKSSLDEVMELINVMDETGNHYTADDYFVNFNQIESVMKILKLQLLFSSKKYKTMKVRTLLYYFYKKRRSSSMLKELDRIIGALGFTITLKGGEPCSLRDVALDDYIVFRLS